MLLETIERAFEYLAEADAREIWQACNGKRSFGTDEDRLIAVLCNRDGEQLERADAAYRRLYKVSLRELIEDECSGDFETFLVHVVGSAAASEARALHEALTGLNTDEHTVSQLILTRSNYELSATKEAYEEEFHARLEDDVAANTGGDYGRLLLACLACKRDEWGRASEEHAAKEARALHRAGKGMGTDELQLSEVLSTASVPQLQRIEAIFAAEYGTSLASFIASEVSGDYRHALLTRLAGRADSDASQLKSAMDGVGTDEDAIAQVLGGAEKHDAVACGLRWSEKYGEALEERIEGECGGDHAKSILLGC